MEFYWTPPANNGGRPITGYEISWDKGKNEWEVIDPNYTGETSVNVANLTIGTTYEFVVKAINSLGISTESPKITINFVSPFTYPAFS